MRLSVREIQLPDIDPIIHYWTSASDEQLEGMGVDIDKLPSAEQWREMIAAQITAPLDEKGSFCMIWELDGEPVGHNNIDRVRSGEEAYMHLHMWDASRRHKGLGTRFVRLCVPYFFRAYNLQKLFCQPNASNTAPNKTLQRAGFTFIRKYVTVPGSLNFEQQVNLWVFETGQLRTLDKLTSHGAK